MNKKIYTDIRVYGHQSEIIEFLRLCRFIQTFGDHGTGRSIKVSIDGDGSGHLQFAGLNEDGSTTELKSFTRDDIGEVREFQVDIGE